MPLFKRLFLPNADIDEDEKRIQIFVSIAVAVGTLLLFTWTGGQYQLKWNGVGQPSGIYFITFQSEQFVQTQKMMQLR